MKDINSEYSEDTKNEIDCIVFMIGLRKNYIKHHKREIKILKKQMKELKRRGE